MSTYYYFYAEIKYNDKWYSLNPITHRPGGEYKVKELMWGQSALGDFVDDLNTYLIGRGIPDDASKEFKALFHENLDDLEENFFSKRTYREYYKDTIFCVNYEKAIRQRIKKCREYKHQAYVLKTVIDNYECGDGSIEWWLNQKEYDELPEKKKRYYSYYEWNDFDDPYGYRYELYQKIESLLSWFLEGYFVPKEEKYLVSDKVTPSDIRVFVGR